MPKPIIFYLEDNPDDVLLLRYKLKRSGIDADLAVASGGQDLRALHNLSNNPERVPAVIILDHNVPGLNALTVIEELRSLPPLAATPIIVISGAFAEIDEEKCVQRGATQCLEKPLMNEAWDKLTLTIRQLLESFSEE